MQLFLKQVKYGKVTNLTKGFHLLYMSFLTQPKQWIVLSLMRKHKLPPLLQCIYYGTQLSIRKYPAMNQMFTVLRQKVIFLRLVTNKAEFEYATSQKLQKKKKCILECPF